MVYKLATYPNNAIIAPDPTPQVIAENEEFWSNADEHAMGRVAAAIAPTKPASVLDRLAGSLHLATETNHDSLILGNFYSQGLNYWAVQMQKQNQLPKAAAHFTRALELNPDNVVAEVNLACNQKLQAGQKTSVQLSKDLEDKFGHRTWDQIMRENGP